MTNVRMQDDFYTAVNQEWLKTAEIPDGQQTVTENAVLFMQLLWNLKFL